VAIFFYLLDKYLHEYVAGEPNFIFPGFEVLKKPKEERVPPLSDTLERGDILVRDFRDETVKENTRQKFETKDAAKIRVVTLNIEMGKQIN